MFVDRVKIMVSAGKGGNGCISFRREKFVPMGGPDGGDGGIGGSVYLKVDTGQQSLIDLHYQQHQRAKHGGQGGGQCCTGACAPDLIVPVPPGTIVIDYDTDEVLADLSEPGQTWLAAKGGRGGLGNTHFKTPEVRAPYKSTPGDPGEERTLTLVLKSVADVGLVGYPNAGKSTLISAITDARPKTAPYPFTTLHPVIGILEFPDFFRIRIADIPGLIDGAHEDIGLGHEFLRHIERCKVLIYILDTAGVDQRKPWDDFEALRRELDLHQPGLSQRAAIIVANKMDLPEAQENIIELRQRIGDEIPIFELSALERQNLGRMVNELRTIISAAQKIEAAKAAKAAEAAAENAESAED
jgi:GTP-binding protein